MPSITQTIMRRLPHYYLTEVELPYHGIIVTVHHDRSTASQVNILFPPVTDL